MAAAPIFAVGNVVSPARYIRDPVTLTPTFLYKQGDPNGIDAQGRHTDLGRIVDPLPAAPSPFTVSYFDPTSSTTKSVTQTVFVYAVNVWDVDAQAFVTLNYPETALVSASNTLTQAHAGHVDADNLPDDVAALKATTNGSLPA